MDDREKMEAIIKFMFEQNTLNSSLNIGQEKLTEAVDKLREGTAINAESIHILATSLENALEIIKHQEAEIQIIKAYLKMKENGII